MLVLSVMIKKHPHSDAFFCSKTAINTILLNQSKVLMEIPQSIILQSECKHCETPAKEEASFCSECGYPIKGSDQDIAKFYAKRVMDKRKTDNAYEKIKSARKTLFIIAGIITVFGFFIYYKTEDIVPLSINLVVSIVYVVLGFWSKQRPLIALILGLLLYLTLIIITAIADPLTLVAGIIWKILIIGYLAKGIYSASSINKAA